MALSDELSRVAEAAIAFTEPGEELAGIVPTEPQPGVRVYLCAYRGDDGATTWLALDHASEPVETRAVLRDVVSIAAMCELAEEVAAGGDLDELRGQLVSLRLTENPLGIEEAEEAVLALQAAIGTAPRVASPAHLDLVGTATRRVEQALDDGPGSPFAEAMKHAIGTVDELTRDIEATYKRELQ